MRNVYTISIRNFEMIGPSGIFKHRWDDKNKSYFKEIRYEGWTIFVWLTETNVSSCKYCNESSGFINGGEFLDYLIDY
jgi:hypothetical protein